MELNCDKLTFVLLEKVGDGLPIMRSADVDPVLGWRVAECSQLSDFWTLVIVKCGYSAVPFESLNCTMHAFK